MGSASGQEGQPVFWQKVNSWLSKVFELNPAGLTWPRAVLFLDVALVPLVVFWSIGHEEYLLSALFGVLFAWLVDPGSSYGRRTSHVAVFALMGAGLTALGFGIGGDAWGWLVLAWAGGAALWIAATFIAWLIRGRQDRLQPVAELPGDTSRRKLTRPLLIPANEHGLRLFAIDRGLEVVALVLLMHGAAIRFWNYALYTGAIAAGALILVDLPQRTAKAPPRKAPQPA